MSRRGTIRHLISKAFQECLVDIYKGEVLGESLFSEILAAVTSPSQVYVLGSMLQLETEAKATLRPLLARLGLDLKEDRASRANGRATAAKLNRLPWTERFAAIHDSIVKMFLPRYLMLSSLITPKAVRRQERADDR
jgi:hypothetical protein